MSSSSAVIFYSEKRISILTPHIPALLKKTCDLWSRDFLLFLDMVIYTVECAPHNLTVYFIFALLCTRSGDGVQHNYRLLPGLLSSRQHREPVLNLNTSPLHNLRIRSSPAHQFPLCSIPDLDCLSTSHTAHVLRPITAPLPPVTPCPRSVCMVTHTPYLTLTRYLSSMCYC